MSVTNLNNAPAIYEWLSIDSLTTEAHAQRAEGVDERRARGYAEKFDPSAVGIITVSRRKNGSQIIIDGAHRTWMYRFLGFDKIYAKVMTGLTHAQESALFNNLNEFKSPSIISKMLAARSAGESRAVNVLNTIERHGWRIAPNSDAGNFAAVAAAERVYVSGVGALAPGEYPELLDRTINLITAAWRHDRESAHQMVVQGVGLLLARFGDGVDDAAFALQLAQERPYVLIGKAKALHSAQGGTTASAFSKVLVGIYNTRRRSGRLPEWVWTR